MTPMRMSPSQLASPLAGMSPFNDIMFSPMTDGILFSPASGGGGAGYRCDMRDGTLAGRCAVLLCAVAL
jgi:hypothetical protein